jgi:hypothetical protein
MADDAAAAMRTKRREKVNGALEAVERVHLAANDHLKGLGIMIAACFARRIHAAAIAMSVPALAPPRPHCRRNGSICKDVITARRDCVKQ